jgi:uncharacterized protein (DUF1800 family)
MNTRLFAVAACGLFLPFLLPQSPAADADAGPLHLNINSNGIKTVTWPRLLAPALEVNQLRGGVYLSNLIPIASTSIATTTNGYSFSLGGSANNLFFSLTQGQMSSNALLAASVLNRLTYGPTPDELERVTAIGPQAFIDEQLNMEALSEPMDEMPPGSIQTINSVPPEDRLKTNWINLRIPGRFTSTNLYLYLTGPGEAYVDDIGLYAGTGTNINLGVNYVQNGDFESPLSGPWTVSDNHINSAIVNDVKCSGAASLRMVATTGGSTQGSSIWQSVAPGLTNNQPCTLSLWYRPRTNSGLITLRLSGSGATVTATNEPANVEPTWIYATATGVAGRNVLYLYLDSPGLAYVDDLKIVAGSVPEAGPNILSEGDFEAPLSSNWTFAPNTTNSGISSLVAHSGGGSLLLDFSRGGSSDESAIVISNLPVTLNATYTISYWYVPSQRGSLTVRLSGNGIVSAPDGSVASLYRRLDTRIESTTLDDLRAWFTQHATSGNRQLLEVLSQFWENHFVTYHAKSVDYLDRYYDDFDLMNRLAANMEYREMKRWRQAMLNPNCTFYDLLKIHVESPAQIIYLDTVDSRGDGSQIANENYARELLELFTMGVDNGYDQEDIVRMSRAWTGWSVRLVDPQNEFNPFATQTTALRALTGNTSISNLVGLWSFAFNANRHGTNRGAIFPGKTYPARLGPPWAGRSYQLSIPRRPTNDTNGIMDGYDAIAHLSINLLTAEYISVKLCRLFVHDEFPNPTTHTDLPEYAFYDYSNPSRGAEAELVRQCIVAWDTPGPDGRRGNLRNVLRTIFNSDLFRSHGGSMQKVKTPVEFVVSAVRALRSLNTNGTATASSDGYSYRSPMARMGAMSLFNRADPDGYPESGPPWISAGTLSERLRYVQSFLLAGTGDDAGNNTSDPVALLKKKLPSASWNNPTAVADYFVSILFPAEGKANLDLYRNAAVTFLNTDDAGTGSSLFSGLGNTSTTYDTRVRGMVSMLMTTQRFQEQ